MSRKVVMPLRDIVLFPHMIVPIFVGRSKSVNALEQAISSDKQVIFITQRNIECEDPLADDLYSVGVLGRVLQIIKMPDNTTKILVEGDCRVKVHDIANDNETITCEYEEFPEFFEEDENNLMMKDSLIALFEEYIKVNSKLQVDLLSSLQRIDDVSNFVDVVAAHITVSVEKRQELLEMQDISKRMETVYAYVEHELRMISLQNKIKNRVKKQIEKTQRDYYLNEQIKAIQKELGDETEVKDEITELEDKARETKLSNEARTRFESEIKKLRMMSPMSAEATVVRNYLEWLLALPWESHTTTNSSLIEAQEALDEEHYGLEKVKERIVEFLAIQMRTKKVSGQSLCFVGPPGVGKTSLARSIATATGRNFVKIALGGVCDEAEIRGHRRTYIGSMPGKIIQGMKKAKSSNPLFLLDEIDKISSDWRGDPSSALLEVLDPEQNHSFNDHYMEIDYDLSNVMFITTANSLNMHQALLDRLEIIRIPGYTESEKMEIASKYLVKRQKTLHGLHPDELTITDDAIIALIRNYTREAGVRHLEREIANLCRKVLKKILQHNHLCTTEGNNNTTSAESAPSLQITITEENLSEYAGVPKFQYQKLDNKDKKGVVTGLAWTEYGGEVLSIEALVFPGSGKITLTGKLGDVMQESIRAALSFVRSRAKEFGVEHVDFDKCDFHIHVPEGATPKDGPSAGIAMATAIVSALTGKNVRHDIAMTGEITLHGNVLAIGGLKEKLLAAKRHVIKTVLIPADNSKDLDDIPENIKEGLNIVCVQSIDGVLPLALAQ